MSRIVRRATLELAANNEPVMHLHCSISIHTPLIYQIHVVHWKIPYHSDQAETNSTIPHMASNPCNNPPAAAATAAAAAAAHWCERVAWMK